MLSVLMWYLTAAEFPLCGSGPINVGMMSPYGVVYMLWLCSEQCQGI